MSTKDFKQGMVAGAKPFGDKLDQLATASEAGVTDIKDGLNSVTEIVSTVLDDLSIQEKKKIYDLDEATDISLLEGDKKEFLVAVLMELANIVGDTSELQKKYLASICNVTGIANPQTFLDLSYIENIENTKTQKILLRHIMEFLFIGTGNYSFLEDYEDDVFSYFNVNKRGFNEIKAIIDRINTAMGIDGIANRHTFIAGYDELLAQEESCMKNSSEKATEDFEEEIPAELEDICITNILQISQGETKVFKYKNITLKSIINCAGTLELHNCVISYNEGDYSDEITFEENSSLIAQNCVFVCKGLDENFFMTFADNCNISLERCIFKDCSFFMTSKMYANISVSMNNCELQNCGIKFLKTDGSNGSCNIDNTSIRYTGLDSFPSFNIFSDKNYFQPNLFQIETKECHIKNIYVLGQKETQYFSYYFYMPYGSITDSTFENAICCVQASVVENCLFKKCTKAVDTYSKTNIKLCVFSNCSDSICINDNSIITQCKFLECKNNIIRCFLDGSGSEISFCEFINCKNDAKDKCQNTDMSDPISCIDIHYWKKRPLANIKKCIFDGIDIDEGFLIKSSISEKTDIGVIVSDCDFRNCSTKRKSGKIIKTMAHYYGFFDKLKISEVVSIKNCRGLDKVSKQASVCVDETKTKETGVNGAKVGLNIGIGITGGPLMIGAKIAYDAIQVANEAQLKKAREE